MAVMSMMTICKLSAIVINTVNFSISTFYNSTKYKLTYNTHLKKCYTAKIIMIHKHNQTILQ